MKGFLKMVIQGFGFHVEELGQLHYLGPSDANTLPYFLNSVWYSSRVTIEATGETQVFQVFPSVSQLQSHANLRALEYGNHRCGNW